MTTSKSESIPRLDSDGINFLVWKTNLDDSLCDKSLAYVLDDTRDEDNDDLICRKLILSSIDENLSAMYKDCSTAKSLMDALAAHFKPTLSRPIALYKQYFNQRKADDCPIGRHIAQMGAAASDLEASGVALPETLKAAVMIDSLPKYLRDVLSDGMLAKADSEEGLTVQILNQRLRSVADTRALDKNKNRFRADLVGFTAG